MQRYFIKNNQINEDTAVLIGQDSHHIRNVMRQKTGDQIIICDEQGICYISSIKTMINDEVFVSLNEKLVNRHRDIRITIAQALIRRERFEYMLQKSTELGVDEIIPILTRNTIIKWNENKQQSKIDRWNTIAKEASEQSHRATKAIVKDVKKLSDINLDDYDVTLLAYEKENQSSQLQKVLQKDYKNILVIIGPEGGFTEQEVTTLINRGATPVGLGPRILRSETASSYILSVLSYVYEMSEQ